MPSHNRASTLDIKPMGRLSTRYVVIDEKIFEVCIFSLDNVINDNFLTTEEKEWCVKT